VVLGVPEKFGILPQHKWKFLTRSIAQLKHKEIEIPPANSTSPKKSLNPFTRALAPPFIGRWRDFYIPITPLGSENIPNVNTHKNVFSPLTHLQVCH
jgi:hypothetical protein